MKQVKQDSSKWINQQGFLRGQFSWEAGYGAFSYAKSQLHRVIDYIKNQEEHHQKQKFRSEYIRLLKDFEIEYNEEYIFKDI